MISADFLYALPHARHARMPKRVQNPGIGSGNALRTHIRPKHSHLPAADSEVRAKNIRIWGDNQKKENELRDIVLAVQDATSRAGRGPEKGTYDMWFALTDAPDTRLGIQLKVRSSRTVSAAQFNHLDSYPDGTLILMMVIKSDRSSQLWWRWSQDLTPLLSRCGSYTLSRGGKNDFQGMYGIDEINMKLLPLLKSALATAISNGHAKSEHEIMTAIPCKTQLSEYEAVELIRKEYALDGIELVDPPSEGLSYDQVRVCNDRVETIQFKIAGEVKGTRHLAPYKVAFAKMGGRRNGKQIMAPYSEKDFDVAIFKLVDMNTLIGWWEVSSTELTAMGLTQEGGHHGGATIYLFNHRVEGKSPNSYWYEPSLRWWRPARRHA